MVEHRLIKIPWGESVLYLTQEEVKEALKRGKAIKRSAALKKRIQNYGHSPGRERLLSDFQRIVGQGGGEK